MINHHPSSEFLAEYVSGALPAAQTVSVTTHLKFCESCNRMTDSLSEVGSELLTEVEPVAVNEDLLQQVFACIDAADDQGAGTVALSEETDPELAADLPRFLQGYVQKFLPEEGLQWRFLSPSLRVGAMTAGENTHELALHRIKAGGKTPEHNHTGSEITVVLKGSFSDEDGVYHPGDFIYREAGEVHRPQASQHDECICLSVLEAPIRLTGVKRVLNPFLQFTPR